VTTNPTPDSPAVQPGQEYESCQPVYWGSSGPEYTRIRVVGESGRTPGLYGFGKVDVVTVTEDGRELRRRRIETSQLHETGTTRDGQPRKSGYRLVRHADGTPAGGDAR
jgi:hypothetical protein